MMTRTWDPAAAALSKSRQWVLTALRAGGELQTVKQLGDRLTQAGHPLKPRTTQTAVGELEAAGLAAGSEEGTAEPATGHRPPPIRMPTAPATVNRAMVGERPWHDPPGNVLDRGLGEPAHDPRMSRWFASSSVTCERHQGRNVLTSAAHYHQNQAASRR
jgi:hypothetical protein